MTPEELKLRDEILSVLFWLQGEGLSREATPTELRVWLSGDAPDIAPLMQAMAGDGLLEPGPRQESYRLSETGLAEGGRRFTEDFADAGLGAQGHGACSDDCDCHTLGPEHCVEHRHAHAGSA